MFCTNCGSQVGENAAFCPNCGQSVAPQPANQQPPQQPSYYQNIYQSEPQAVPAPQPPVPEQPMNWFKFLIYFSLFAAAVLNLITGIRYLNGSDYGADADAVYRVFPDLQGLDTFMGLACIALAAVAIFARFALAGYKANGPKLLMALYIAVCAVDLIYIFAVQAILPEFVVELIDFSSLYSNAITSAVIAIINYNYFKKRKHLFVN